MFFGYRRLIAEKDARIEDLKKQIARLESLVPAFHTINNPYHISVANVEQNAILDGRDDQIELTPSQTRELDALESEASRLISGNYE